MRRAFIFFICALLVQAVFAIGVSQALAATTRYEETDLTVTWTGVWTTYSSPAYSGGSTKYTTETGATATFAFTGTTVTWFAAKAANRGIAKVYIDNVYDVDVDLYSSSGAAQQQVYTKSGLTNTSHTIRIEVTGTKNLASSNTVIDVDAFEVTVPDDVTPPTTPTNLTATAISYSQINLSWDASTDNVGVVGYKILRSTDGSTFFEIATSVVNSFSNTSLSGNTTYYYRVVAYDAAGNNSGYSNLATATTPAAPLITRYEETDFAVTFTGSWTSYSNPAYSGGSTKYTNQSGATATLSFAGSSVTWIGARTTNRGIAKIYIDDLYEQDVDLYSSSGGAQQIVYTKTGLSETIHTIKIEVTGTKNPSSSNTYVDVDAFDVVGFVDTSAPTVPTNLTAIAVSSSQIELSWDASVDNIGVVGYKIERGVDVTNFNEIGTSSATSYSDSGLIELTTYYYRVRATDGAGNLSPYSNNASDVTKSPVVTIHYEETDPLVAYTGSWTSYSNPAYSGGSTKYTNELGATATLSFIGSSVTWIGARTTNRGIAKIYIDDLYEQDVDLYSSSGGAQQIVYTKTGLSETIHTIKIEVTGTKNPSSSNTYVDVDAFDVVGSPPTIQTMVQTDPSRPDAYGGWFRTIPTITLSRNMAGTSYYQWDTTSGTWTTYDMPFNALAGTHTLYFYSADSIGNAESTKIKRFKVDTAIDPIIGHRGCTGCHGVGSTYVGGDHETYWRGTPHDTALATAPAGCERCHDPATSTLSKLLRSPIPDPTGAEHIVIGNDNTLCAACHISASYGYGGLSVFQGTRHFAVFSSGLALTAYPDASYAFGMCGNCHNPHGVAGTTDYTRAARNDLCITCHDDAALPAKPTTYAYQGQTNFSNAEHGSQTNSYNIWPNPNDTGAGIGSGGATSGQCINCHNPHGKSNGSVPYSKMTLALEENLCYGGSGASGGCHAAVTGSVSGVNISERFTLSIDDLTHHNVTSVDQATVGSKLECINCHNPHLVNATNKVVDPEVKSSFYTATMTDPKDGSIILNYIGFCNKCHDNVVPSGVTMPSSVREIQSNYQADPADPFPLGINETGDWHGIKSGTGWGQGLLAPYSRGMGALPCSTCHDSHGNANVYHFKETVNGKTGISVTDSLGRGAANFCTACHSGDYHQGCGGAGNYLCHGQGAPSMSFTLGPNPPCFSCHTHNGIENWPDPVDGRMDPGYSECDHCHIPMEQGWYPGWWPYN